MSAIIGLVAEGDSMTSAGNAGQGVGYVYESAGYTDYTQIPGTNTGLTQQTRTSWRFVLSGCIGANVAIAGSRLNTNSATGSYPGDLAVRVSTWVDPFINAVYPGSVRMTGLSSNRPDRKYILSVMIGTNPDSDILSNGTNYSLAATHLASYLQARVSTGFHGIIVCTILSRGDGILGDFETYRQGYNAILRSGAWLNSIGATAIACADFGNEPTIGAAGACNDAALFSDTVHPTPLGYNYMTPLYLAAVNAVKAAL